MKPPYKEVGMRNAAWKEIGANVAFAPVNVPTATNLGVEAKVAENEQLPFKSKGEGVRIRGSTELDIVGIRPQSDRPGISGSVKRGSSFTSLCHRNGKEITFGSRLQSKQRM